MSQKLTFFLRKAQNAAPPFPPALVSQPMPPPPLRPPLGLRVQGTGNGVCRVAEVGRKGGGGRTMVFRGGSVATPSTTGKEGGGGGPRQEGRVVTVVGVPRCFGGRNVRTTVGYVKCRNSG